MVLDLGGKGGGGGDEDRRGTGGRSEEEERIRDEEGFGGNGGGIMQVDDGGGRDGGRAEAEWGPPGELTVEEDWGRITGNLIGSESGGELAEFGGKSGVDGPEGEEWKIGEVRGESEAVPGSLSEEIMV